MVGGEALPTALAALTTTPAGYLGLDKTHGTIAAGKVANLVYLAFAEERCRVWLRPYLKDFADDLSARADREFVQLAE